ncbi:MOSC domain-containing protein [Allonocardiopsis opalescens]|uniref:MOSC domain-containing protein n=1 Tax=Allonocardiopsis opalescens TaxID=1144618 RepID=A0A2T0Q5H6_9ACTN|nr:MOSC N-terminal beta barrel domain-containing protein [Allonocardiopsis opalescens]PRX99075.1 hypothetical protein CLV72_104655 [Allonocardiopsis opalescens]
MSAAHQAPPPFRGSLARLYRWPVKSLRGEAVPEAALDAAGLAGDRAYTLLDERPNREEAVLTVRQRPAMLHWAAAYPPGPAPSGPPVVTGPDGTRYGWEDPTLAEALAAGLDLPLRLGAALRHQDRPGTVLVTTESSRAALEAELGAPVDLLRFRPNLHLALDAPAFDEETWGPGTVLTIGAAVLETGGESTGPCVRCAVPSWDPRGERRWPELQSWVISRHDNLFGTIMQVTRAGVVRVGDPVTLQPAADLDTAGQV